MESNPDISVALCTYNGEEYIQQQLDSILNQEYKPSEIIICDDVSTDDTWDILQEYSNNNKIIEVFRNKNNLGITKNFEKAMSYCSGDAIALSDQDDVWYKNKLKSQKNLYQQKNGVLVFHDSAVDFGEKSRSQSLWDLRSYEHRAIRDPGTAFSNLIKNPIVQGASMLIDSGFCDRILPIPDFWAHDYYISLMAVMYGNVYDIDSKLINWRQHKSQEHGVPEKTSIVHRLLKGAQADYTGSSSSFAKWKLLCEIVIDMKEEQLILEKKFALKFIKERMEYHHNRAIVENDKFGMSKKMSSILANATHGYYRKFGSIHPILYIGKDIYSIFS